MKQSCLLVLALMLIACCGIIAKAEGQTSSFGLSLTSLSWEDNADIVLPSTLYSFNYSTEISNWVILGSIGYGQKSQSVGGVNIDGSLLTTTSGIRYKKYIDNTNRFYAIGGADVGFAWANIDLSSNDGAISGSSTQIYVAPTLGAGVKVNQFGGEISYSQFLGTDFDGVKLTSGLNFGFSYYF